MLRGKTLAEQFSKLTSDEILAASNSIPHNIQTSNTTGSKLLKAVSTSCRPLGHSQEAAADAWENTLLCPNSLEHKQYF